MNNGTVKQPASTPAPTIKQQIVLTPEQLQRLTDYFSLLIQIDKRVSGNCKVSQKMERSI
ncbi:MAG: hypothetical protein ABIJ33_00670 [Patescibacteria group bacterium]